MARRTIVAMPGDGIGKTVLPEAIRVMNAVGFEADYLNADIGWEFWCKEANALPDRTIKLLEQHKIGLFGAITSKPKDKAQTELDPSLQGKGHQYFSPIVTMRQLFDLDICIRPCKSFPGNPLNFIRRASDARNPFGTPDSGPRTGASGPAPDSVCPTHGFEEPKVDAVVFRQNTECLYCGVEWTNPPADVRKALETHKKMRAFAKVPSEEMAISLRIFTRGACQRIARAAFEYAKKYGYKSVTMCEKPNVVRETSGMMEAEARKIAKEYDGVVQYRSDNIDAVTMWLTKNPENYGVIIAGNMFGDIISDGFAGLVGGLGFACSANIGREVAVFEPTHGSAPKYEKLSPSIVNPIAMILAACMMLDHIGETDKARRIKDAVARVVAQARVRTYDMLRLPGGPDVFKHGAATTPQMTDAVIAAL